MPQIKKKIHFPVLLQEDSDHTEKFSLYTGFTIIKATDIYQMRI